MIITNELIESLKTRNGGWTKRSLAVLGINWPPTKGWKNRIIGNELAITDLQLADLIETRHD